MAKKNRILSCLTRAYLIEIAYDYEITGVSGLKKDDIVRTLSRKRSVKIEEVLEGLSLSDLKTVCQGVGVDDTGRKKALLVDRLLDRDKKIKTKATKKPTTKEVPAIREKKGAMKKKQSKSQTKTKNTNKEANLGFEQKLWAAADKMRGHMDAAEYKHVALGLIFLKHISDSFQELYDSLIEEEYADPEDRDEYLAENVFWVPKQARWQNLQDKAKQPTIGQLIDDAMVAIEKENPRLKGVLPKTYARKDLDKQRLGELIDLIGTITLGDSASKSKDILGRVYEYFLGRFAAAEGKSGGEFYTPSCVVRLLVEMIEPYKGRVYDPCCGSGGMFVQSERFVEAHGGNQNDIAIYGQESNPTTWRLCKMNLAIRGIEGNIGPHHGDSFHNDLHKDLKSDYILANPPFNISDWGGEKLREDKRWKFGTPPVGNANFAWVQHKINHLSPNGVAGFVLANVSLSSNTGGEDKIRKAIVEADLVDCIVTLPGKLFYSTPISVCLWIINRNKAMQGFRERNRETLFIDAMNMGQPESRTHSLLLDEDITKIASTYKTWKKGENYKDVSGFCKSVTTKEISKSNFVLFPAHYVGVGGKKVVFKFKEFISSFTQQREMMEYQVAELVKLNAKLKDIIDELVPFDKNNRPKRLDEFRIGDFLISSNERLSDRKEPEILTCTERAGLIFQKERFAKRVATSDTSKYKVVRKTDIVYNPYLLWAGSIDQCWIVDFGITSPAYEVLSIKDGFDPTLIGYLLTSKQMIKRYSSISMGTVQRRRRAPVEKFVELKVYLPPIEEQNRFTLMSELMQNKRFLNSEIGQTLSIMLKEVCGYWLFAQK